MKISTKLYAGFATVVAVTIGLALYVSQISDNSLTLTIGRDSAALAEETMKRIDHSIHDNMNRIWAVPVRDTVIAALHQSNEEYGRMEHVDAFIDRVDSAWLAAAGAEQTQAMQEVLGNGLALELYQEFTVHEEEKHGLVLITEIFITNRYGALIAASARTSDFRQDDEKWWQDARSQGMSFADVALDESSQSNGINIAIRIDDRNGEFIGIINALLDVKTVIRMAELSLDGYASTRIKLLTRDGRLIYSTRPYYFMEDLSGYRLFSALQEDRGFYVDTFKGEVPRLYAYAKSKGYQHYGGFGWILIIGHDLTEILAPAHDLRRKILFTAVALVLLSLALSYYITTTITRSLTELNDGVKKIGEGDFNFRVKTASMDEHGQLALSINRMAENLHQITASRDELNSEIREREKAEQQALHLNQVLRTIREINRLITKENNAVVLIQEACDILIQTRSYQFCWITLLDDSGTPINHAKSGLADDFRPIAESLERGILPDCALKLLGQQTMVIVDNPGESCEHCSLASHYQGKKAVASRLEHEGHLYGFLVIAIEAAYGLSADELGLVEELSGDIAFGLQKIEGEKKRLQAMADLEKSEAQYFDLYNNSPDFLLSVDAKTGCITTCNQTLASALGRGKNEIIGKPVFDIYHPDCRDLVHEAFAKLHSRGEVQNKEFRLQRKDGSGIDVILNITVIRDAKGAVVESRSSLRDISLLIEAEEAMRESEKRFRFTFEQAAVGIAHVAPDGSWLRINQRLCDIVGYTRNELLQATFQDITHPEDLHEDLGYIEQLIAGERAHYRMDKRYKRKDGSEIWISLTVALVRKTGGEPDYFISVVEDISERKKAEKEVHRLNTELEQRVVERTAELTEVNRELEAFAYSVSHDLRAPLRAISGFSLMLLKDFGDVLTAEARRKLNIVKKSAEDMGKLIDGLLSFSRLGRESIMLHSIDAEKLVREVFQELLLSSGASNVKLVVNALPFLWGDATMLKIVFTNLLSNAMKYVTKDQSPVIEVSGVEKGGEIAVSVRDNGVGFDMQYADKLFKVFQRLHSAEEFDGTGIGLALVSRIISRHGGRVWAEAELNKGATFFFTLPRNEAATDDYRQSS